MTYEHTYSFKHVLEIQRNKLLYFKLEMSETNVDI